MAMQRVREAAEKVKIELFTSITTDINLPYKTATNEVPKHLTMTLTRAKLEQLKDPVIKRLDAPILKALKEANLIKEGSDLQNLKIKSYSLLLLSLTRLHQKLDSKRDRLCPKVSSVN